MALQYKNNNNSLFLTYLQVKNYVNDFQPLQTATIQHKQTLQFRNDEQLRAHKVFFSLQIFNRRMAAMKSSMKCYVFAVNSYVHVRLLASTCFPKKKQLSKKLNTRVSALERKYYFDMQFHWGSSFIFENSVHPHLAREID